MLLETRDSRVPLPIELGAEYIHGEAPETEGICRDAELLAYDVSGVHRIIRRGTVSTVEFRRGIDRVLRRIDTKAPDESLADFLRERPGGRSCAARQVVRALRAG